MKHTQVNPKFKDSLFRLVFRGKEELLSLYNAVNGSDYQNPEDLMINTLEDVVYMGMKNDVSFLFADVLSLYEHQSTFNPNIPLRGIFYHSRVLRNYVEEMGLDIYSRKLLILPMPIFMVFYNGAEHQLRPQQGADGTVQKAGGICLLRGSGAEASHAGTQSGNGSR